VPQEGKPDKKIYRITDAGLEELRQWYREPTEPTPIREDLLVKVLATPFASEKQLVKELQRRRHMHCEKLMHYRGMEDEYKAHPDPPKVPNNFATSPCAGAFATSRTGSAGAMRC
jgi:hypothetical protein